MFIVEILVEGSWIEASKHTQAVDAEFQVTILKADNGLDADHIRVRDEEQP